MKRTVTILTLLLAVVLASGCSRAIKEGIGVARGAKGTSVVVSRVSGGEVYPLREYDQIVVQSFGDQTGVGVPSIVSQTLPTYIEKHLQDKGIPTDGDGPTLTIRGTYLYYESANNTTDQLFGPLEELVARVELVGQGGQVLAVANCVGRTTESVNKGPEKKAEGLAKAIVDWMAKHYPEPEE